MGIRLIVEVLQHAPATLTHREKLFLVVLAENANDETRTTWNSIESPEILRGAQLSRAELYAVLKKLIAKGVVKRTGAGQKNATAKYELLEMAPQCLESPDTETPGQSQQNPDTDAPQSQQGADTEPEFSVGESPTQSDFQCRDSADVSVSKSPTPTPPPSKKKISPPRPDIERVCAHLADRIESNGSKRPAITAAWRTAARLMLDKDSRTEEQVHGAIDWCQDHTFWRANVLSMPKLRERYDQLRLKAVAEKEQARKAALRADPERQPYKPPLF